MTSSAKNSTTTTSLRPQPGEYAPYYERYISLVPGNDVLAALAPWKSSAARCFSCSPDAPRPTAISVMRPKNGA